MAEVTIYGASDDLIEVYGDVTGESGALRVVVQYDKHGNWGVGVAPVNEDTRMLPVVIDQRPRADGEGFGYSARAVIGSVTAVVYESDPEA